MALSILLIDSFDHYATGNITEKWNAQIGVYGPYTAPSITTAAGRRGNGLALTNGGVVYKSFADSAIISVGFIWRTSSVVNRRIAALRDEEINQVYLQLSSLGKIQVFRGNGTLLGSSSQTISATKFYHIEMRIAVGSTTGSVTLNINGQVALGFSASPANTQVSSLARANTLSLGDPTNNNATCHYDDVFVTTGDMLGPQYVDVLRTNGDVVGGDMSPVGVSSSYQAMDDTTPDGDSTYVYSPTSGVGGVNFCQFENFRDAESGAISAVALHTYGRKEYGNTRAFSHGLYPGTFDGSGGSTQYFRDLTYVEAEYAYHSDYYTTNPGSMGGLGGSWTVNSLNALRAGFKRER